MGGVIEGKGGQKNVEQKGGGKDSGNRTILIESTPRKSAVSDFLRPRRNGRAKVAPLKTQAEVGTSIMTALDEREPVWVDPGGLGGGS